VPLTCEELASADDTLTKNFVEADYTDKNLAPGTHTYTYEVTTTGAAASLTKEFTVDFELVDPCATATINTQPASYPDKDYTITDVQTTLALSPQFTVTPDFCPFQVTVSDLDTLDGGVVWDEASQTYTIG